MIDRQRRVPGVPPERACRWAVGYLLWHMLMQQHDTLTQRLLSIRALLVNPLASSVLRTHPNDVWRFDDQDMEKGVCVEWRGWWDWAASSCPDDGEENWITLVRYYNRPFHQDTDADREILRRYEYIPEELSNLIDSIRTLQLERSPSRSATQTEAANMSSDIPGTGTRARDPRTREPRGQDSIPYTEYKYGMSPKKTHEVARMTEFVRRSFRGARHIVDVGAGQGYLTRALASLSLGTGAGEMQVLALDSSEAQTSGAERWEGRVRRLIRRGRRTAPQIRGEVTENAEDEGIANGGNRGGRITHKTIHITSSTLLSSIDEWIVSSFPPSPSPTSPGPGNNSYTAGPLYNSEFKYPPLENRGFENSPIAASDGNQDPDQPTAVLLVALHACGSLTPSILRAFLSAQRHPNRPQGQVSSDPNKPKVAALQDPAQRNWIPAGLVLVGCCYNLLEPSDFPLSQALSLPASPSPSIPSPLPASYLHLAAQIPNTWLAPTNFPAVKLAIRKVVWRALVGGLIAEHQLQSQAVNPCMEKSVENENDQRWTRGKISPIQGTGETPTHRRLGKINDRTYDHWEVFLKVAGEKMGINLLQQSSRPACPSTTAIGPKTTEQKLETTTAIQREKQRMESRLEVLHTLRCLLGPLVESMILLDRLVWAREQLLDIGMGGGDGGMDVELVNLFDQATGSGRNVAIVMKPSIPSR